MKKYFFFLMLLPLAAFTQSKPVIATNRYFPKADKVDAFEKAVAAHAQKYHKGDHQWRVYSIETGPDAGGYMVIEGPTNWDGVDKRGNLGDEHMKHWNTTVQPLLQDKASFMYFTFREDLSTAQQTNYASKISILHWQFKPGYYGDVITNLQARKKLWEEEKSAIAVYESSLSGEPQFSIVTRYYRGLAERDVPPASPMPVRFSSVNGQDSWPKYISFLKEAIAKQWTELLFHKPDMDSK